MIERQIDTQYLKAYKFYLKMGSQRYFTNFSKGIENLRKAREQ